MKIAVVAANGRVAQKVIKEALDRGFKIKAFGRDDENKTVAKDYVKKDIMDLTKEDLAGFDAVVDGFGAWTDEEQPMHIKTSQYLCDLLRGSDTRLLIVGGAGSLYVNPEHTVQVKDAPDFPAMFLPLANAQGAELDELRKRNDVKWTFISRERASISSAARSLLSTKKAKALFPTPTTLSLWLMKSKTATIFSRESA